MRALETVPERTERPLGGAVGMIVRDGWLRVCARVRTRPYEHGAYGCPYMAKNFVSVNAIGYDAGGPFTGHRECADSTRQVPLPRPYAHVT